MEQQQNNEEQQLITSVGENDFIFIGNLFEKSLYDKLSKQSKILPSQQKHWTACTIENRKQTRIISNSNCFWLFIYWSFVSIFLYL
jgi:hypothetical protein